MKSNSTTLQEELIGTLAKMRELSSNLQALDAKRDALVHHMAQHDSKALDHISILELSTLIHRQLNTISI